MILIDRSKKKYLENHWKIFKIEISIIYFNIFVLTNSFLRNVEYTKKILYPNNNI